MCVCVYGRHLATLTAAAQTRDQWWLRTLGFEPDSHGFESGLHAIQQSLHYSVWGQGRRSSRVWLDVSGLVHLARILEV